jgi:hypothetical protein
MKLGLPLVAVFFAAAAHLPAQTRAPDIQLTKITRSLIETPEFTYNGAAIFRTNTRNRWLAVDVDFSATPVFTDEATFKYYVLLDGKLLTGEVTHVNILAGRGNR